MEFEKLFTFICFGLWLFFTIALIMIAIFKPNIAMIGTNRRLKASNPYDLLMFASIGSWLAMWCFRSMY
ncbi:hypothetical protein [Alishewanella phage vB_AspM_Slickus01]|nr:hypothetical protein [Alishewanella phage vB_AspM_Slickus01]